MIAILQYTMWNTNNISRAFFTNITIGRGAIAPRELDLPSPLVAVILPGENLQTWLSVNTSKGTEEFFSSNHAIFCFSLHEFRPLIAGNGHKS